MSSARETIRFRGHDYPVLDSIRVSGRKYVLLEKLAATPRERYKVFDPTAGPDGDLRALHILPRGLATIQRLKVLKRLSPGNGTFPTLLEYHAHRDKVYVVMTWVWGQDLRSYLRRARTRPRLWPSPFQAFMLFRRLAHGVSLLHHHANCIHGDLKPENLIVASQPSRVVLIDLGSAWTAERTASRANGDGRTDGYASPEQVRGEIFIDARSDQFSASVIGYELIAHQLPYDNLGGKAGHPEYGAAFAKKLVPPSELSPSRAQLPRNVWRRIDAVIVRGLALDAGKRYPNRNDWLSDLDAIDAELRLRPRISGSNKAVLSCLDWLSRLSWVDWLPRLFRRS
jgi:serine/threonine protein kinase